MSQIRKLKVCVELKRFPLVKRLKLVLLFRYGFDGVSKKLGLPLMRSEIVKSLKVCVWRTAAGACVRVCVCVCV